MRAGRFITFEGPEGGGKTTQAKRLIKRLREAGREVLYTREPGGTPTGEVIRDILQHDRAGEPITAETEVFLFAASRAQLVRRVIIPALDKGDVVVCDRFADSTTAYQGYGRGFSVEQMLAINAFAIGDAQPDLTLLLDVDVAAGRERTLGRGSTDRIEREDPAFFERVRRAYLARAAAEPVRFRVIDAGRPPAAVREDVLRAVAQFLTGRGVTA